MCEPVRVQMYIHTYHMYHKDYLAQRYTNPHHNIYT